ncbi:hypothetical protein V499_01696 [Pseudogymnoascus sp. VKM F-103]|uniref:CFEM domain-containing protein n=1 Tax=Pseudogymnoascus verrucosus TaxID=342668 RepID=A0A1B8GCK2_9PEZI|nr:uncharacterized protein VE01_08307 [Pseudogymnoascus verrucosus]KFY79316.1 hypothetical protein V499_01696 [Pseudogymnoascus sp. VKM F-103]OBT93561.1 hypothetical protein VE01_08307 [Pseudogymnoascus verrucosus]
MLLLRVILPWTILLRACFAQQDLLSQLPQCALLCFAAALPTTTCSATDLGCLCVDAPFINTVAACNAGNCTVVENLQSTNQTYAACGVPIRSQGTTITGLAGSFGVMAWVMVVLRLIHRHFSTQAKLGWDDYLVGLAGLSSMAMTIPALLAVKEGFGTDIWGLTPTQITNCLRFLYLAYPFYMTTEAFCQVSILAFYLRFMMDQKTLLFVKGLMVFVTAFGIANTFCMIFSVTPINFFWNGWKGEMVATSSIDMNLFSFVRGGIEIGLDLVILCLPLPMLAKLHMSLEKKIHIMSMFCVGFVITGVSCARLHALVQFAKTSNPTYDNTPTIYWCAIEADLFIIVACMPSIHAVFSRMRSSSDTGDSTGYDRSDKSSYFNRSKRSENSGSNQNFGGISKSTEVNVYSTERADASDVELVDRPAYLKDFDRKAHE